MLTAAAILAQHLARFRKAKGWSQLTLAERSGVHYQTIGLIENGHTPTLTTLQALAGALEVPLKSFFEDSNAESL